MQIYLQKNKPIQKFRSSKNGMDLAKLCPDSQHYQPQTFKPHKPLPVLCFGIKIIII